MSADRDLNFTRTKNDPVYLHHKDFPHGYTLLILMFVVFLISMALLAVIPLWQTQIQRELEQELIFRGNQYVEAIRIFQSKNPGKFPSKMEDLEEEKCIRKLYRDPMSKEGIWNAILSSDSTQAAADKTSQTVIVATMDALSSISAPKIIGVVSTSRNTSVKIYNGQVSYDKWLFFIGQDPNKSPEIIYYGQSEEE